MKKTKPLAHFMLEMYDKVRKTTFISNLGRVFWGVFLEVLRTVCPVFLAWHSWPLLMTGCWLVIALAGPVQTFFYSIS